MSIQVVLDYLGKRYDEEQSRFKHFEDKSSRFLSFLSVAVGGVVALGGLKQGLVFQPASVAGGVVLIAYLLACICLACSWGHAMLAVRVGDCPVLPKSRSVAEYLSVVDEGQQHIYMYRCYVDTLDALSGVIDEKAKNLELSYQELAFGASFLAVALALLTILEVVK